MKSIGEMMDILDRQRAEKKISLDNSSKVTMTNTKWVNTIASLKVIPATWESAIKYVEKMPGIKKSVDKYKKGTVTRYTKDVNGYEFIYEVQNHKDKGLIQALLTLYDHPNSIVAKRDLLQDEVNKL